MVRFKTRWLLLAIDDKPLATSSPFPSTLDTSASPSTSSSSILSAAQQSPISSTKATLTPQLITRLLRASLVSNFGDVAAGAFGGVLTCKYYSTHTGTAIVRCSRDAARLIWASATLISSPVQMAADGSSSMTGGQGATLRIRVIHCGGTIKKVQTKAIELDRKLIMRLRAKQKRLSANDKQAPSAEEKVASIMVPMAEKVLHVAPVIPIAPVEDDEDLGEALDTGTPIEATPATTTTAVTKPEQAIVTSSSTKLDPETQALLAQSCKQINSISH